MRTHKEITAEIKHREQAEREWTATGMISSANAADLADAKGELELVQEVFEFLDDLRECGTTNMFGAAVYIQEAYGYTIKESRKMLSDWMDNYGKEEGDDNEKE